MFAVDFLIKFLVKCLQGSLIGLLPLLALIIYLKNHLLIATNLLFVHYSFLFLLLLDFESPSGSNLCIKFSQFNVHKVICGQSNFPRVLEFLILLILSILILFCRSCACIIPSTLNDHTLLF